MGGFGQKGGAVFTVKETSGGGSRFSAIQSEGFYDSEEENSPRRRNKRSTSSVGTAKKVTQFAAPKKSQLKVEGRKNTEVKEQKIEPWGFGKIFRIAIIVLVIIAVIFVVGSQLFGIKESMD